MTGHQITQVRGCIEIPEWHGAVDDVVSLKINHRGSSFIQSILDDKVDAGFWLSISNVDTIQFPSSIDCYIDGVLAENSRTILNLNQDYEVMLVAKAVIKVAEVGAERGITYKFNGTISNIKLTNQDGSDSRFYESVIKSETEPETLVLEDSISGKHGTLKNFPENAVWKDITPIEIDGEQ